ncbi:hypothetical protein F2Q70_00025508 [Brassica cretica]|uniref:Uncharacterized protein n=1 Tax=Brassica cretica TaxID=69181 RepID=A0A8S9L1P7_BRACR|nr:hypothetical protein F2Q70_00025508 [Brassica cretica]KAF3593052.1 hypothetical protein DY000_02020502 [Brassica cretica]
MPSHYESLNSLEREESSPRTPPPSGRLGSARRGLESWVLGLGLGLGSWVLGLGGGPPAQ